MGREDAAWFRESVNRTDEFYIAKYDEDGNVRPGWSFELWTLERVAGIKPFGSKGCHTALSK